MVQDVNLRFEKYVKVDKKTQCHNWIGGLDVEGYGVFYYKWKYPRAYRFNWESKKGNVPKGYHLHHRCNNKRCVNVDHLELLLPKEHIPKKSNLTVFVVILYLV